MRNLYYQRGQTGLLVLLIMTVVLTIGVSVATRSVSEIKTSRQEEDSTKAFNQAEEAVEEILSLDTLSQGPFDPTNDATAHIENIYDVNLRIEVGQVLELVMADGARLNMTFDGNCGSAEGDGAVVVTIFNNDTGPSAQNIIRQGIDPCASGAPRFGFSDSAGLNIVGAANDKMTRIRAISAPVNVSVSSPDLAQGFEIRAQDESTAADVTRAVQVDKYNPSLPNVFDYALFSGSSITH